MSHIALYDTYEAMQHWQPEAAHILCSNIAEQWREMLSPALRQLIGLVLCETCHTLLCKCDVLF